MIITQTPRVYLRQLTLHDAAFVLDLMNQPSYHHFIGDRGLRDVAGAMDYIQTRFIDAYERLGFGLYAVVVHGELKPAGICGLVKRDTLPGPDLGFAFLPQYWSQGLAREAAQSVLVHAQKNLQLQRLWAITSLDNGPSIRLLEKIGFAFQENILLPDDAETLKLFSCTLPQGATDLGAGQV